MSENSSDRAGGLSLVVLTVVTWLMVLLLQGCAGSLGSTGSSHDSVLAAGLSYCTELCRPFGVLAVDIGPSPDGTSPFSCDCMPAGIEMPEEEPEEKPKDDANEQQVARLVDDEG